MKRAVLLLCLLAACALAKFVPTPFGYMQEECVHKVPHGSSIQVVDGWHFLVSADGKWTAIPKCKDQTKRMPTAESYDGWLAFTSFNVSDTFDTFTGYFSVPDAPKRVPEMLYYFTGLQNVDWIPKVDTPPLNFDIIQPVLQYPGDSGHYWSMKSWYVTVFQGAVYSDEVKLSVGDRVFGNMTRLSATSWFINSVSAATGKETSITIDKPILEKQPWAYCVFEGYGLTGCETEPTVPIHFTEMVLTVGDEVVTPKWTVRKSPNPYCSEQATVIDPATVDISFQ
eukprot:TRINITY_DN18967_c0_g1_i1.p1 TRINITY_DN18967_c0_g1~~TRINITY_DN18967_c0_g1_i1.p1  ORF type:complete len:291 (+),score=77.90 TRINITY_DN18967_c0_g1_i1:26-874(+)